ncbi:hypothetical protein MY4824_002651 [Beauveria thailandica]
MDGMRLLDQHIDRSLWPIDPAEAATYYFIWDLSPRGAEMNQATEGRASERWLREDDACTITSVSLSRKKLEKEGGDGAGGAGGLLGMVRRACRRGGGKRMQKGLMSNDLMAKEMREKHQHQHQQKEQNEGRRWSEATLVERRRSLEERKLVKD